MGKGNMPIRGNCNNALRNALRYYVKEQFDGISREVDEGPADMVLSASRQRLNSWNLVGNAPSAVRNRSRLIISQCSA